MAGRSGRQLLAQPYRLRPSTPFGLYPTFAGGSSCINTFAARQTDGRARGPERMSPTAGGGAGVILLDAAGLAASRPGRALFADISVTIEDGDRIGVVGLNGSGKSTLLRQLAGRLEPEAGVVRRGRGARTAASPPCTPGRHWRSWP